MKIFLILITTLACGGCMILPQAEFGRKKGDIRVAPGAPQFSVGLRVPTLDPKKKGEIDAARSYAVDAKEKRIPLLFEKIDYVENYPEPSYFIQRNVYLDTPSGRGKKRWPNGKWMMHVELVSQRGREVYESEFKIYPLLWTPFTGPLN